MALFYAREHRQPVSLRVAVQLDEDVHAVRPDLPRQIDIAHRGRVHKAVAGLGRDEHVSSKDATEIPATLRSLDPALGASSCSRCTERGVES